MNIKSLLMGSAATLVAATSAQAADAIVVEPEPVEYVRVCDAYGTGFFFIPGTETCIRFNGFIRSAYEKVYVDQTLTVSIPAGNPVFTATTDGNGTFWGQRARLNVDTRNETEWGTLRGLFRLEADGNEDTDIDMDVALISLAGFRAGFVGGNYWSTNHGFGGINAEGIGSAFNGVASDGLYGFNDGTVFDYTFAAEGFSVTIGVEDPRIDYNDNPDDFNGFDSDTRANFYAGFNYSGDWGGVAFTAVHDSQAQDVNNVIGVSAESGEWAYKASINLDLSEWVPGGALWGWYMNDGDARTNYVHSNGIFDFDVDFGLGFGGLAARGNPESIWGVAFQANLTDEVEFWANYWHADGGFGEVTTAGVLNGFIFNQGDAHQWGVGLNWYPSATPGFHIKTAYFSGEVDHIDDVFAGGILGVNLETEYDGWEVVLRRDF